MVTSFLLVGKCQYGTEKGRENCQLVF